MYGTILYWQCECDMHGDGDLDGVSRGAGLTILHLTAIVFCGGLLAGLVGSLTGLGGGIIITPLLTLLLGVDIHYAIGAALISVIATSSGAAWLM